MYFQQNAVPCLAEEIRITLVGMCFSIAANTSEQLQYVMFPNIHKNNSPFF